MINEALELQTLEDTLREWSLRLIVLTDNHNVEVKGAVDWLFVFVETWRGEVQIERRFRGVSTTIEHLEKEKAVLKKSVSQQRKPKDQKRIERENLLRITDELETEKTAQSARLAELRICREGREAVTKQAADIRDSVLGWFPGLKDLPPLPIFSSNGNQGDRTPQKSDSVTRELAQRKAHLTTETVTEQDRVLANKKISDQAKYPHMTAREIKAAVGISLSAVYEHPDLEKVSTGTRKRLWTTESVIKLKNSQPSE
jgi:hypothetical protein